MKKIFSIISILTIASGVLLLVYNKYEDTKYRNEDSELLQEFFEHYDNMVTDNNTNELSKNNTVFKQKNNYLAVIKIPSISLYTGIVMSDSSYSTMNRNVSVFPTSDFPDVENGNFVLFAHSGTSRVSYFKNISKLKNNDEIYVYYKNNTYVYRVIKNYDVSMMDHTPLNRMENKTIITLITCKIKNNKYRTIIVGEMVE